ncbi:Bud-site selection protein [Ganoderma leucocontextum]|nr:Bud-site selection protein [Ganoderma leucocontextum]
MAHSRKHDASTQHGQKRKRPSARRPQVKQESQAEVIAKKLHHGIHEVRKAAKKAEAFEVRKLVKRLKAARNNSAKGSAKGDDPAEMERQWEVLKGADHERFGNTALRTKILKDGLLSRNEDVKAAVEDKLSEDLVVDLQEPGSSATKVYARLLSSKILADAVHAVVDTLKEVLNPSLANERAKADDAGEGSEEESEGEGEVDEDEEDVVEHSRKGKKAVLVGSDDEESGSEAEVDGDGWESGTVDGGEVDDGAGWESGSINEDGDIAVANSSDEDSDEDSDGDEDRDLAADDDDMHPAKKAKSSGKEARPKLTAGGVSTFLPSLAVGYTRGDSDASDISDDEGAAADAPRKNRRGQRARRAIWEKKYGGNANHVKQQQQQYPPQHHIQKGKLHGERDERGAKFNPTAPRPGRDPRHENANRDGVSRSAPIQRHAGGAGLERIDGRTGGGHGGNGAQGEKPLHPSWEAKKKLKEKQNPGIVLAQGKKITFA